MKRHTAYFRCDASAAIGGGHVVRCLALADGLAAQGWECVFLSGPETPQAVPDVKRYAVRDPGDPPGHADLLIVDHYGLDEGYEFAARGWAAKILVIDDLVRRHDCDILMDQTFGREEGEYGPHVPSGCRVLTGAAYALLRPQFADSREGSLSRRRGGKGKLARILITFGAIDEKDAASYALKEIEHMPGRYDIDVVLGAGAPHIGEVERLAGLVNGQGAHRVNLHVGVRDMASLMAAADLCIGAGGTTTWERCCLGLPAIIVTQADNQAGAQELEKAGAAVFLGPQQGLGRGCIEKAVAGLRDNPGKLMEMSEKAAGICDGLGAKRLVSVLESAMKTP